MISTLRENPGLLGPDDPATVMSRLLVENEQLRRKLETQPVIEQAKGILMGRYGVHADAAFAMLCRWSQNSNTKLHDIAETLTTSQQDAAVRDARADTRAQPAGSRVPTPHDDVTRRESFRRDHR